MINGRGVVLGGREVPGTACPHKTFWRVRFADGHARLYAAASEAEALAAAAEAHSHDGLCRSWDPASAENTGLTAPAWYCW